RVAEGAAEVGGDDLHLLRGQAHELGEDRAVGMGSLGGEVDASPALLGVDVGEAGAALQRGGVAAWVVGVERGDVSRRREGTVGGVGLPGLPLVAPVVGFVGPYQGGVRAERLGGVDEC